MMVAECAQLVGNLVDTLSECLSHNVLLLLLHFLSKSIEGVRRAPIHTIEVTVVPLLPLVSDLENKVRLGGRLRHIISCCSVFVRHCRPKTHFVFVCSFHTGPH